MIVIGLTGSMGMGKTTAANMLRDMGLSVHCSDDAVHDLLSSGGAAVLPVSRRFPSAYDKKKNAIDRKKLRDILGQDEEKIRDLEDIIHPLVVWAQNDFLREQTTRRQKIAVLDIPLLFETGAENRVDCVICVTAPEEIQRQRVMARPGMTQEVFDFLSSRQLPDQEKRKRADFVVQTGNGLAETRKELEKIVKKLKRSDIKNNPKKGPCL